MSRRAERFAGIADPRHLPGDVESAFRGDLLARFRHQAAILRLHLPSDTDHLLRHRHFQIHPGLQELAHEGHVTILNVPPILAQVQSDAVRAALFGEQRGVHRIRVMNPPGLAQRRHMIDVHSQGDAGRRPAFTAAPVARSPPRLEGPAAASPT